MSVVNYIGWCSLACLMMIGIGLCLAQLGFGFLVDGSTYDHARGYVRNGKSVPDEFVWDNSQTNHLSNWRTSREH